MEKRKLSKKHIELFKEHLINEEKSEATIDKYLRDIRAFCRFADNKIDKRTVIAYKQKIAENYSARSVNSMLAAINMFFSFLGWNEYRVKSLKLQQQIFYPDEKELTKSEYIRLCRTAEKNGNERLSLILQTICATGIRISELQYITVEALQRGEVRVTCKGKQRTVFIVKQLKKKLLYYINKRSIKSGSVFITRTGKPVSRTNIWKEMKNLCIEAEVNPSKVFPHNLRHLFARVFYGIEKDIAKLADILGHNNINTTRIYIVSTGSEHKQKMEKLKLII